MLKEMYLKNNFLQAIKTMHKNTIQTIIYL